MCWWNSYLLQKILKIVITICGAIESTLKYQINGCNKSIKACNFDDLLHEFGRNCCFLGNFSLKLLLRVSQPAVMNSMCFYFWIWFWCFSYKFNVFYSVIMIVILGQSNPLPAWIKTFIQVNVNSFVEFFQGLFWNPFQIVQFKSQNLQAWAFHQIFQRWFGYFQVRTGCKWHFVYFWRQSAYKNF